MIRAAQFKAPSQRGLPRSGWGSAPAADRLPPALRAAPLCEGGKE